MGLCLEHLNQGFAPYSLLHFFATPVRYFTPTIALDSLASNLRQGAFNVGLATPVNITVHTNSFNACCVRLRSALNVDVQTTT